MPALTRQTPVHLLRGAAIGTAEVLPGISGGTVMMIVGIYEHLIRSAGHFVGGIKGLVTNETFKEPSQRKDAKKALRKLLEERYTTGKNKWFFTPLRVCPILSPMFQYLICIVLVVLLCLQF